MDRLDSQQQGGKGKNPAGEKLELLPVDEAVPIAIGPALQGPFSRAGFAGLGNEDQILEWKDLPEADPTVLVEVRRHDVLRLLPDGKTLRGIEREPHEGALVRYPVLVAIAARSHGDIRRVVHTVG